MKLFLFILILNIIKEINSINNFYYAKAWQSASSYPDRNDYPEASLLASRPKAAISFTGGGSRSYLASLGYLAGFNELNLIPNIRYITGISGGSWATTVYSYKQIDVDDIIFLGPIVDPKDFTLNKLEEMDDNCARSYTNCKFVQLVLSSVKNKEKYSLADGWAYATQKFYFEKAGIKANVPFSWNEETVNDIKKRNPSLYNTEFMLLANKDRPYPIIGTGLVGPSEGAGYQYNNFNITMLEMTPLYVGQMRTLDVSYHYHTDKDIVTHYKTVGGVVEPFAFGRFGEAPLIGIKKDQTEDILKVPIPLSVFDLQYAGGASGYAEGLFMESLRPYNISSALALHFDYWSPSNIHPSSTDTMFCDGGSYENIMIASMLQRRMEKIVLFFNTITPLLPKSDWDVYTEVASTKQVDDGLSALFGVLPQDYMGWQKRSFDFSDDQFFSTDDWTNLITKLQDAQQIGNGVITTLNLTTVENVKWGIPSGITSQITFVYLGRVKNWESELPDDMKEYFIPKGEDADDMSKTVSSGPFKGFPHYITSGGLLDAKQANALSDLTGWVIKKNFKLFQSIFIN